MIRKALTGLLIFSFLKVVFLIHAGLHGWMIWVIIWAITLLPWSLAMSYHQDAKWRAEGRTNFFDTNDAIKVVCAGFLYEFFFGEWTRGRGSKEKTTKKSEDYHV